MSEVSRRSFVTGAIALLAGSQLNGNLFAQSKPSSSSVTKLNEFTYGDVKLTGGPLKEQFDRTRDYYLALDDDRILKVYRDLAGIPTSAKDMGGWYDAKAFAPGHALGQWMSALSRFALNGSEEARAKVSRLVEGFDKTVNSEQSFYAAYRFPGYTFDKHVIGLVDAYRFAGIEQAKKTLATCVDRAVKVLPEKALTREEQAARPHKDVTYTWDEFYTLPENLFIAAEAFSDERYLEMAKKYLHDKPFFDPLAEGKNILPGLHAYSHVNCLSSAARAYLTLRDEKYLRAIRNAWDMLEKTQWFASGGWGPNEAFVEPGKGKLAESLTKTHKHFETPCGSYAHFKLARYLMRITGESHYGDGLERMLYNGILAALPMGPEGKTFYYSDYSANAKKSYHPDPWPCCSGTYPQVVADYLVSAYFHDEDGIYVNLFVPSEVKWQGIAIVQETDYPDSTKSRLQIRGAGKCAIHIRVPMWADRIHLSLNGARAMIPAKPGTFQTVQADWKDGDVINVEIPLNPREEAIDSANAAIVATMNGPVLIAETDSQSVPFHRVQQQSYTVYHPKS